MNPFFSIIIPTRNRHETVFFTINTIINQDFRDFELIISDNSDIDNFQTLKVIQNIQSDKINYVRTKSVLSMSENWEFGLSHVNGKYIIFIGDDDALMPNSLNTLHQFFIRTNYQVIRWDWIWYMWPKTKDTKVSNQLTINTSSVTTIEVGVEVVKCVSNFQRPFYHLPMLYNSAISKVIVDKIKSVNGRFFNSMIPDVFSGFAIAMAVENYLSLNYPLSINGASEKSNGQNISIQGSGIFKEFKESGQNSTVRFYKDLPYILKSRPVVILEPFFQAKELLQYSFEAIDLKKIYSLILESLTFYNLNDYQEDLNEFNKVLENKNELKEWFTSQLNTYKPKFQNDLKSLELLPNIFRAGLKEDRLIIDTKQFGVEDVLTASELAFKLVSPIDLEYFLDQISKLQKNLPEQDIKLSLYMRIRKSLKVLIKGRF